MANITPLTHYMPDVVVPGARFQALVRAEDETLRTAQNGYLYFDAGNPLNSGHAFRSSIGDHKGFWTPTPQPTSTDIVLDPAHDAFNGAPAFVYSGNQHFARFNTPVNLVSYTVICCCSVTQAAIDAVTGVVAGQRYLWMVYDSPLNDVICGLNMSGVTGNTNWAVIPIFGVTGAGKNISWATFPQVVPVADEPFILSWRFLRSAVPNESSSRFYFNSKTPIVAFSDHATGHDGSGQGRYWKGSFGPGSNTVGWDGVIAKMYFHDDSNPDTALSDAQHVGILEDWAAYFDVTLI